MNIKHQKLINYFRENNLDKKPEHTSWKMISNHLNVFEKVYLSPNACRKAFKRYKHLLVKPNPKTVVKYPLKKEAKILVFDIETAPLSAYVWRLWKQNVHPTSGQLRSEWFLLTYAAKWLFEKETISGKLTRKEVLEENDERLVKEMWNLMDEADIVIAHYGKGFDVPMMNARFLKHGLNLPMPYKIIDTKYHAAKQFALPSYKLDYLATYLGFENKKDTDFELWVNCLKGDQKSLDYMEEYNIRDVTLLEEVYLAIRQYIQPHPNLGLYIGNDVECCPSCASKDLKWDGQYYTYANTYDAFRCNSCGATGRAKKTNKKRVNSTRSTPTP